MSANYQELLLDPRWQKKRLQILNRDKFTCRCCEATNKTLHVHHLRYDNIPPWEYEDIDLITLCDECHKLSSMIDKLLKNTSYGWEHITALCNLFNDIESENIRKYLADKELTNE